MPWTCKLVEYTGGPAPDEIGAMWYAMPKDIIRWTGGPPERQGRLAVWGYTLSDEYVNERQATRRPLFVRLPCRSPLVFLIDSAVSGETRGWQVTGEPPNITVSPSINIVGLYHGWLKDGVLSDDVEGRSL